MAMIVLGTGALTLCAALYAPGAVFELLLPIWLIVKGFATDSGIRATAEAAPVEEGTR